MGKRDYFRSGDYNVLCDRCGAKFKASECELDSSSAATSDYNLFVCYYCKDELNPQDFVRGLVDDQRAPIVRSRPSATFLTTNEVQPEDL